jgi:hypothetical protein
MGQRSAQASGPRRRLGRILHLAVFFALFLLGVFVADPLLEPYVRKGALDILRRWLEASAPAEQDATQNIAVLDIGPLYPAAAKPEPISPTADDPSHGIVLRPIQPSVWTKLLESLEEAQPAAIGIDVDCSPFESFEGEFVTRPEHLELMRAAAQFTARTGIPVWMGVGRGLNHGSKRWFEPAFRHMAAAIFTFGDLRYQPLWFEDTRSGDRLPSMAVRLGTVLAERRHGVPALALFGERHRIEEEVGLPEELRAPTFFVDYSPLRPLMEATETLETPQLSPAQKAAIQGKTVLLGRAAEPADSDYFTVDEAGRPQGGAIVRGVYAHACGAYTFGLAPVQRFSHATAVLLDFGFGLLGLLAVWLSPMPGALTRRRLKREGEKRRYEARLSGRLVFLHYRGALLRLLVAAAPVLLAFFLARYFHIVWLEFAGTWVYLLFEPFLAPLADVWAEHLEGGHA